MKITKPAKKKKAVESKLGSKKSSKTCLIDGINCLTKVEILGSHLMVEDSMHRLATQATEERTSKKHKLHPEELYPVEKMENMSLVCHEKFDCSNLKSSPQDIHLNDKEAAFSKNIVFTCSTMSQDNPSNLLSQQHSVSQNLMSQFEKVCKPCLNIDTIYHLYNNMIMHEEDFFSKRAPNPLLKQKFINSQMRTILLNWILEVSSQLFMKRETYHLTVFLIDTFLQKHENLQTSEFQLLGVVCLMIAAKFEEITIPHVETFSLMTESAYKPDQIICWETLVLKVLDWRVSYTTLASWSNLYIMKWDEFVPFIQNTVSAEDFPFLLSLPSLRKQENYYLFSDFFQILDLITLHSGASKYKDRSIVLSLMYLLIGINVGIFTAEAVSKYLPLHTQVLNHYHDYNLIFTEFLSREVGMEFCEIVEAIQFASRFFILRFDYTRNSDKDQERAKTYEDWLQIQTYNQYSLLALNTVMKKSTN